MVPSGWALKRLKEVCDIQGGKRLPKGRSLDEKNTGYPYLRVSDMRMGGIIPENIRYVPADVAPRIAAYRISSDDLFITVAGTLGLVGEVPANLDGANLTENADKLTNLQINKRYLLYYLQSDAIQRIIASAQTQNAQPKLALTRIRQFPILVPPRQEQEKIAGIIGTWDEIIEKLQRLLQQKRERKRGLMQVLLTGKKRFKEFRDSWSTQPLASHLRSRQKGRPVEINSEGKGWPYVGSTAFDGSYVNYTDDPKAVLCEPQDVLLLWDGEYAGKSSTGHRGAVGSTVMALKLEPTLDNVFLDNLLQFYNPKIRAVREGSGIPHMPGDFFEWFQPLLPSMAEQRKIASVLTAADAEIVNLEKQLDAYKLQKRGLMQQLLTGKKRVKIDELEAVA